MKEKIHAGHLGINSCLRRARELIFWPGMSSEIRQFIESCGICAAFSDKQASEPLFMHPVPSRPWGKGRLRFIYILWQRLPYNSRLLQQLH
ncbi:hypothetical protein HOLleu_03082 [Holothuria leucospilota]|uniref:Integrase zinc-binding domain-containing protein n=1 Tax=Holothuria leucospilota TaxID=206669 RepID=A0A9Q1CR62_HOLLE|nr:hypothetical protein HOLleu_03082 [Holothuria leucospilota]